MMHHRTKDGKLCCVRVTSDHLGPSGVYRFDDFDLAAEFDTVDVGDKITLEYIEMTDAEFEALGELEGW